MSEQSPYVPPQPGQLPPGYPPPRPPVPADRIVTALALMAGAGLAIGGSFLTVAHDATTSHGVPLLTTTFTCWGNTYVFGHGISGTQSPGHGPLFGIPLVLAAVVALVVAVRILVTPRRPPARAGVLIATGFLVGVVATVFTFAEGVASQNGPVGADGRDAGYGAGIWLLIAAAVVTLVALLITMAPRRPAPPAPFRQ